MTENKLNISTIIPGVGLGELKFGLNREEVAALLGQPEEKEEFSYSEEEEDLTESWHYDELELSIGFDQEDGWRLTTMSVTSEEYAFEGFNPIGMEVEALKEKLNALNIEDLEYEDVSSVENPDTELIFSEALGMNFWFIENTLAEVQWVPHFGDDENVKWPA